MDPTWIVRLDAPGGGPRLAVKDCIDVEGLPTTAGCQMVAEQAGPAARDAPVVAAARRAGARIVGKTNLTELCWSASGVNAWSGTPANPLDPGRMPGGSSSGSAVAVAAGEADVALGTDTGGSVRIPAACCGIAGLKTTWGRVPLDGVYPLAPSMDTVGPLGADLAAVELGMRLIDPGFAGASAEAPARVGRIRPALDLGVDPATDAAVDAALATLAGLQVTDVTGFDFRAVNEAGKVAIDIEGYQANEYLLSRLDRLAPHNQRAMTEAARITAEEAAEAARARQDLRDWFAAALDRHPVLALPTLTGAPPLLGERGMSLTMPANLAGLPALSLPVPGGPAGLPASLQLIGPPGGEERLIALGRVIEAALTR
jgi:amidase